MATPPHIVDPRAGQAHTHTIIFLHGRDSTAAEFADELLESEASDEVAGLLAGPGKAQTQAQTEGLERSVALLGQIVGREEERVPRHRMFLAGISQGFVTALAALLSGGSGGLAGLIGWCSWMPCVGSDAQGRNTIPVFLAHARDDEVVPLANGESLRSELAGLGFAVEWHVYEDGGHWINEPRGVDDMSLFIQRRMDVWG